MDVITNTYILVQLLLLNLFCVIDIFSYFTYLQNIFEYDVNIFIACQFLPQCCKLLLIFKYLLIKTWINSMTQFERITFRAKINLNWYSIIALHGTVWDSESIVDKVCGWHYLCLRIEMRVKWVFYYFQNFVAWSIPQKHNASNWS